jgi:hypothetical protein
VVANASPPCPVEMYMMHQQPTWLAPLCARLGALVVSCHGPPHPLPPPTG